MSDNKPRLLGIEYLESLPLFDGKALVSFDTTCLLFEKLGNPQNEVPTIHVAGTNGKGSVCAMLAAIIRQSGANVGQFSSPHLSSVCERCNINGRAITEHEFNLSLSDVIAVVEKNQLKVSYFVLSAAAVFLEFARRKLDYAVVEVGLGGLYDATNTINKPLASVITSIGLDHTDILGGTIREIAFNKAGIIKKSVPVFTGNLSDDALSEIYIKARKCDTSVQVLGKDFVFDKETATVSWEDFSYKLPVESNSLLQALFQQKNAALAVRVASYFGFSQVHIEQGLVKVRWPGRVEEIDYKHGLTSFPIILDAAHNPEGVQTLIEYLTCWLERRKLVTDIFIIFAAVDRKDWKSMISLLFKFASSQVQNRRAVELIFTKSSHPSSVNPQAFASQCSVKHSCYNSSKEAFSYACSKANSTSLILICGSIFLLGDLRTLICKDEFLTLAG